MPSFETTTPPATMITPDEMLRTVRRAVDFLGTKEFARRAGVKEPMISNVVQGKRPVSDRIAAVVGFQVVKGWEPVAGFDASGMFPETTPDSEQAETDRKLMGKAPSVRWREEI